MCFIWTAVDSRRKGRGYAWSQVQYGSALFSGGGVGGYTALYIKQGKKNQAKFNEAKKNFYICFFFISNLKIFLIFFLFSLPVRQLVYNVFYLTSNIALLVANQTYNEQKFQNITSTIYSLMTHVVGWF